MKKLPWILLISIAVFAKPIFAKPEDAFNLHDLLQKNLSEYVYGQAMEVYGEIDDGNIKVDVNGIDPRIAIPQCLEGFRFSVDNDDLNKKQFSARVACESQDWFTYSSVKLMITQNVVVTKGTLSPNTVLTRQHLKLEEVDSEQIRHTGFSRIEDVVGATLKYRLRGGQSIQRKMLCYVCEGDRITIAAKLGGMQVKTTGIAQEDGTLGDTIEVMNIRSKKIVFGEVQSAQEVIVSL